MTIVAHGGGGCRCSRAIRTRTLGDGMTTSFRMPYLANNKPKIVSALQALQQRANGKLLRRLYDLVVEDAVVGCIDAVLQELTGGSTSTAKSRVLEVGRYLASRAGHREAVKFGMALIGVFEATEDSEILHTLGTNEELTLFAAVAIAHITENPEQTLWKVAKSVHGWGRIQIVRRLKDTRDPNIQAWMLREGFKNEIMDEYLACMRTYRYDGIQIHHTPD